ncbi:MAG: acyl-CoA dehydrogenase family protein, partial [Dehalococcoidia bacterium]|nr:acyl-CoA dehydrogenase family protein [Dehalococcoidia bacterium]
MDFRFSPEDETFRREIRAFLAAEWPGGTGDASVDSDEEYRIERVFEKKLAAQGWLTLAWPPEHGGRGATHVRQAIMKEECSYVRAPIGGGPGGQATGLVGPAIMAHGTEEQKRRFLPPIAAGDVYWCQGFSEPDAGSDLASVQTRAERAGDTYLLNGHKVWTSGAAYADWVHVLARTDPEAPKHKGISYLLVDMRSPGISCRPIPEMTGRSGFYETFFENVQVPIENLLGAENRGWYVATTTLGLERSGIVRVGAMVRAFDDLVGYLRAAPAGRRPDDPQQTAVKLAGHRVELQIARLLAYRVASLQDQGQVPTYEASVSKMFATEAAQRLANTAVNVLGLPGTLTLGSRRAPIDGLPSFTYLLTVHWTISAGANEIQRN